MGARLVKLLKRAAWVVGIAFVARAGLRAYDSQRGPPLELWHTYIPHELSSRRDPQGGLELPTWQLRTRSSRRCARRSPRSWTMKPRVPPIATSTAARSIRGASRTTGTVRLSSSRPRPPSVRSYSCTASRIRPTVGVTSRGLSRARLYLRRDPPARSRHGAERPDRGAMGRLVGGDSPGGERSATTDRADRPLHLIGYSNGGALAMKYALDAHRRPELCHRQLASS